MAPSGSGDRVAAARAAAQQGFSRELSSFAAAASAYGGGAALALAGAQAAARPLAGTKIAPLPRALRGGAGGIAGGAFGFFTAPAVVRAVLNTYHAVGGALSAAVHPERNAVLSYKATAAYRERDAPRIDAPEEAARVLEGSGRALHDMVEWTGIAAGGAVGGFFGAHVVAGAVSRALPNRPFLQLLVVSPPVAVLMALAAAVGKGAAVAGLAALGPR